MAGNRTQLVNAAFALLGGLVCCSLLLILSLLFGWFPEVGSIARFQALLLGTLLAGGIVLAVPLYLAFARWELMYP